MRYPDDYSDHKPGEIYRYEETFGVRNVNRGDVLLVLVV